jgi:three-Cys-motif partner protein
MSKDFFDKPFTEDTNVKLELYREYLKKWFPVFIASGKPFVNVVNLFDFFCGTGKDSEGTHGSPLIALGVLNLFKGAVERTNVQINLYFNDQNTDYLNELKSNIDNFHFNKSKINLHFSNEDFVDLFPKILPKTKNAANLMFLDQFGIKYVNKTRFKILIELKVTDILFFISSSTFNRFPDDPNVVDIIGLDSNQIKKVPFYDIHRLVHQKYSELIPQKYSELIPQKHSYGLAPFSIKKGKNIYGLIFGSGHPLGLEKFLEICWERDGITGEANFDIQGDIKKQNQPSLFEEDNKQNKISKFEENLRSEILNGNLDTDLSVFLYAINNGFIARHIIPIIQNMKKEMIISVSYPSFKCSTVWKTDSRKPKTIEIL